MKLLERIKNANPGETIEVERLTDCCRNMRELEDIVTEIRAKNICISSRLQPWVNSEVLESLLREVIKARKDQ